MFQTSLGVAVGAAIALLLGCCLVGWFVRIVEDAAEQPLRVENGRAIWTEGKDSEVWDLVMKRGGSGPYVGAIEVLVFFIGLWSPGGWPLVAGWLAFKVASKWKSWAEVSDYPEPPKLDASEDERREYATLRHKWTARRGATFMAGTGANIIIAALGVGIGRLVATMG